MVDELRDLVEGRFGRTPAPVDPALQRAVELFESSEDSRARSTSTSCAPRRGASRRPRKELLLLALFGEEAEPLLKSIRERAGGDESLGASGVDRARAERIREVVRIVQETGVGEITIEEDGTRVSVRRTAEQQTYVPAPAAPPGEASRRRGARDNGNVRVESPMVGTFYRAPAPGSAAFRRGRRRGRPRLDALHSRGDEADERGQGGDRGIVRKIHVGNGEPVEYGQLLFELEPINGRPLDAV